MKENEVVKPWYRQPWLWFLILFPAMSIGYCAVAITLALTTENSMVTDDYSKEGLGINQDIERDMRAASMGIEAEVSSDDRQVTVKLASSADTSDYPYLVLQLFHPTLSDRDAVVQLQPKGDGVFQGMAHSDISGRWYVDVRGPDNDWRLKGEVRFPAESAQSVKPMSEVNG